MDGWNGKEGRSGRRFSLVRPPPLRLSLSERAPRPGTQSRPVVVLTRAGRWGQPAPSSRRRERPRGNGKTTMALPPLSHSLTLATSRPPHPLPYRPPRQGAASRNVVQTPPSSTPPLDHAFPGLARRTARVSRAPSEECRLASARRRRHLATRLPPAPALLPPAHHPGGEVDLSAQPPARKRTTTAPPRPARTHAARPPHRRLYPTRPPHPGGAPSSAAAARHRPLRPPPSTASWTSWTTHPGCAPAQRETGR